MTSEEIVQALRQCAQSDCSSCGMCPIFPDRECVEHLAAAAASLIERLTAENEALRKKLAMSDKDVTAAHLHFGQWQAAFIHLTQTVSRIEDEDKVGELCAAIKAQLAAWEKTLEGTP